MKWFRLYTEIRRDPKLRRLPVSHRWVWVTILCMARESPKPGWLLLRKDMPAQPADIADEANVSIDDAARAIELFKSKSYEMLEEKDGTLRVINWAKRQFENDSSTERVRRYRQRQNQQKSSGNERHRYSDVPCNGPGNVTSNDQCNVAWNDAKPLPSSESSPPQENCSESSCNDREVDPNVELLSLIDESLSHAALQGSPAERHRCNSQCNVVGNVTKDVSCNVTSNVAGNAPIQSYRSIESNINNKELSVSIHCAPQVATEPENAPELPTLSAPDGAVFVQSLSDEEDASSDQFGEKESIRDPPLPAADTDDQANEPTTSPQDALSSSKLSDQIAIERLSPSQPYSTTYPDVEGLKTVVVDQFHPEQPEDKPECVHAGSSALAAGDGKTAGVPSAGAQYRETGPADGKGAPEAGTEPPLYLTKRRRKLSGWKLEAFEEFMAKFGYKRGRAAAADAWLDIPNLTWELVARIIRAAEKEARARPALIAKGLTPKMAQGWINDRRWEDWEDDGPATHKQDSPPGQEESRVTEGSQRDRADESQYSQTVGEAIRRFL